MWFDNLVSSIMGWFIIQGYLHPQIAFWSALVAFALYCWTIDYIGYLLIRRKSEALQAEMDAKRGNVPIIHKDASERLYASEEEDE